MRDSAHKTTRSSNHGMNFISMQFFYFSSALDNKWTMSFGDGIALTFPNKSFLIHKSSAPFPLIKTFHFH